MFLIAYTGASLRDALGILYVSAYLEEVLGSAGHTRALNAGVVQGVHVCK